MDIEDTRKRPIQMIPSRREWSKPISNQILRICVKTSWFRYNRREKSAAVYLSNLLPAFSFYYLSKVLDLTGTIASSYWIPNGPSEAASNLCINTNTALSHMHICCEVGVGGCLPHWGDDGLIIIGASLSAGSSPTVSCQEHLCSPPTAPLVWNAALSAAVISHAAPRPGARCFTILIQRETISRLLLLSSLCFGADLKKKKEEINETEDRLDPFISKPICSFWKDNVKFNSENNSNLTLFSRAACIYDEKTLAECEISKDGAACLPWSPAGLKSYTSPLKLL